MGGRAGEVTGGEGESEGFDLGASEGRGRWKDELLRLYLSGAWSGGTAGRRWREGGREETERWREGGR